MSRGTRSSLQSLARNWCFTSYEAECPTWDADEMKYLVYQMEECPETGRYHWQGYVEFWESKRGTTAKKLCAHKGHFEKRMGTRKEARDYCMKTDTRVSDTEPIEEGNFVNEESKQGSRSDIHTAAELAKKGDFLGINTGTYARYHKGLHAVFKLHQHSKEYTTRKIHVYYGVSGSSKSTRAWNAAREHKLPICGIKWEKGWANPYEGEQVVIFDEFHGGKMSATDFITLCDWAPTTVNVKGDVIPWMAEHIYITTQHHPRTWWTNIRQETEKAVIRRITTLTNCPKRVVPEPSWDNIPTEDSYIPNDKEDGQAEDMALYNKPKNENTFTIDDVFTQALVLTDEDIDTLIG